MKFYLSTHLMLCLVYSLIAQDYPQRPNAFDIDSLRHGEWVTFYDSLGTELSRHDPNVSHYCLMNLNHGKPMNQVGCFYPDGIRSWTGKLLSVNPEIMQGQILMYHKNGALMSKAFYENDTLQGPYKGFYPNGILEGEGYMQDNQKTGQWTYFYDNGNLFYSAEHINGLEHGAITVHYSNGTKYSEGTYEKGIQEGASKVYHENGILANEGIYKNGLKEGLWQFYHETGEPIEIVEYREGKKNGTYERFYANGQRETNGTYKDDLGEGYFQYYYENGQLNGAGTLSRDLYQGPWTLYYDNGQVKSSGNYVDDLEEGLWTYYFDNGNVNRTVNYQKGQPHGEVTYYYSSGQFNASGLLFGENKEGKWEYYFENGIQQGVVHYKDGLNHGSSQLGNDQGILLSKGNYENGLKIGYWEFFYDNGQPSTKGEYTQDLYDGKVVNYFENGNKKNEGSYKMNNRVGPWKYYHGNGEVSAEGDYEDGKSTGHWVYYYDNGNKSKEGEEYNDVSLGGWTFYDRNGRISSRGGFENGVLHGPHVYYDADGQVSSEYDYVNGTMQSFSNLYDSVDDLSRKGDFEKAWLTLESTEKAYYRQYDKDDLKKSDLYELYGIFYTRKKDLKRAEQYFKKSLKNTLKYKSDTSTWYTSTLDDLADVYTAKKDYQKAYEIYQETVRKIKARPNGRFSDEYATSQRYLTVSLMNLKRHDEAIALLEEDMEFRENLEDQKENVAGIYFSIVDGLYPELSPKLDSTLIKTFKFLRENDLENHWAFPYIHYFQALVYRDRNQADSAYLHFNESIRNFKQQNDTIRHEFVNALVYAGNYHYNNLRYDLSMPFYERAGQISEHPTIKDSWIYGSVVQALANQYWAVSDYQNTLKYYQELIRVAQNTDNISRLGQGYTGVALAYDYMENRSDKEIKEYHLKGITTLGQIPGYDVHYVGSNMHYATFLENNDQQEEAAAIYYDMLNLIQKQSEIDSFNLYRVYRKLALNHYQKFAFDSSEYYSRKVITGLKDNPGHNFQQYMECYRILGDINSQLNKDEVAMTHYFKAVEETEKFLGTENEFYFYALLEVASGFSNQGIQASSIKYYKDAVALGDRILGPDQILGTKMSLANEYVSAGEFEEAFEILSYVKSTLESRNETKQWTYMQCLREFSNLYEQQENRYEAEKYLLQALEVGRKIYDIDTRSYSGLIRSVGQFYLRQEEYTLAYQYVAPAIEILEERLGDDAIQYAWYAETLSQILFGLDNFAEAINLQEKAANIYLNQIGEGEDFMNAQFHLGELLSDLGQYERSLQAFRKSANASNNKYGRFSIEYTKNLKAVAHTYLQWKKTGEAMNVLEEVKDLYDSIGVKRSYYAVLYNYLGWANFDLNNRTAAEKHYKMAIHIADSVWGPQSGASKVYRNNLAFYHLEEGEFNEAEALWIDVQDRFSDTDFSSVEWEDNMAMLYTSWNKLDKAEPYWDNVRKKLLSKIKGDFPLLSEQGKAAFWDAYKADFEMFNTYAIKAHRAGRKKALGQMFDNQLQTKSILLNSSTKERRRILNSGNKTLIDTYNRYISLKEDLVKYYGQTAEQLKASNVDLSDLELQAENLEKALSIEGQSNSNEKERALTWKSIQRSLTAEEAAVELIRFRYFDRSLKDSIVYAALILTPETTSEPILEVLPNGAYLEEKGIKAYRTSMKFKLSDERSYKQFWEPIEKHVAKYRKVYLSSDGVYHQMNVATLRKPDGTFVGESHEFRLVSSTRTVAEVKNKIRKDKENSAYIFGNPTFDLSHSLIESDVNERGLARTSSYTRATDLRGFSFTQLPGTKVETETVNDVLVERDWRTNLFLADDALEEELKRVNNPGILHIATHGFFLDAPQGNESNRQLGIRVGASKKNALLRSGLLMSGATQTANGQQNDAIENGIFTAYEAMNLDLSSTELVVLSACETGLGEIKNGEGVFGLQRAFQIAGAESILMSLWKVDDAATQLLMTSFYKAWLSGSSKTEALSQAQSIVKSTYPHPNYWGAFVLVGG